MLRGDTWKHADSDMKTKASLDSFPSQTKATVANGLTEGIKQDGLHDPSLVHVMTWLLHKQSPSSETCRLPV
jgi:hypothetical protein